MTITTDVRPLTEAEEREIELAREHFEAILDDYGTDHRAQCMYVNDDDPENLVPECIIGVLLHRCEVPVGELLHHEGTSAAVVLETLGPFETDLVRSALNSAQGNQDLGVLWGAVVDSFEEALRYFRIPGAVFA